MNPSKRFDQAIKRLYLAFNEGRLNPECCTHCAVGNILGNNECWTHFTDRHGSLELTYVGKVNQVFGKRFNGYTPMELLEIEAVFLKACGYQLPIGPDSKKPVDRFNRDMQFDGLCAVTDYLCQLDGIPNPMAYYHLFDHQPKEKGKPSLQLA